MTAPFGLFLAVLLRPCAAPGIGLHVLCMIDGAHHHHLQQRAQVSIGEIDQCTERENILPQTEAHGTEKIVPGQYAVPKLSRIVASISG